MTIYDVYSSTMSDDAVQAVEREMAPKLAAFQDQITQNEPLFRASPPSTRRAGSRASRPSSSGWRGYYYTNFVRAGAKLDAAAKKRMAEINQDSPRSSPRSARTCSPTRTSGVVLIDSEADLAGLPTVARGTPRPRLPRRKAEGQVGGRATPARASSRSSPTPTARDLREKVWRMFVNRGDDGGATDNNATISRDPEAARRAREAARLRDATRTGGSRTRWRKTPERAMALMEAVWPPAVARVHEEVADMQALADKEHAGIKIEPWDYRYYAEKVRKEKYDLDETAVKPYLQLEKLREGMFCMAKRAARLRLHAGQAGHRARLSPGRARLGGDRRDRRHSSASGTSTRTRARASAPARG